MAAHAGAVLIVIFPAVQFHPNIIRFLPFRAFCLYHRLKQEKINY